MRLLRVEKENFVFHLGKREKCLLLDLLALYPVTPGSHQRVSRSANAARSDAQQLLEESLAEHKRESRQQLAAMLSEPARFRETESGYRLTLTGPQSESLLQALNEIRIGCWLKLGCPAQEAPPPAPNAKTAPLSQAMELAGYYEMMLLSAFEGRENE